MADRTITYYDVVQEILKRVNDAEGDVYLDRAKSLVYEGISTLAVSEGVTKDDIVGILKSETVDVGTFSPNYKMKIKGDSKDLDYNPARIISIVDDFTDSDETVLNQVTKHRYIELSLSEVNRLNDPDYSPFNDEIFYYQRGDFIYFYPQDRMINQKLIITYIAEPDSYSYVDSTDDFLSASFLDRLYSSNFIYKVVDYGVGRIREQQSGE